MTSAYSRAKNREHAKPRAKINGNSNAVVLMGRAEAQHIQGWRAWKAWWSLAKGPMPPYSAWLNLMLDSFVPWRWRRICVYMYYAL